MRRSLLSWIIVFGVLLGTSLGSWADEQFPTVDDMYLGLSMGPLRFAHLNSLPQGVLLRSGDLTVDEKQLMDKIHQSKPELQDQLRENAFYVLEQVAARPLLLAEARKWEKTSGKMTTNENEDQLFQSYFESLIPADLKITNQEAQTFFNQNQEVFGQSTFEDVREMIIQYLLDQKKQEVINDYIQSLSEHLTVEVNADWVKAQAELAFNNPVDKARRSGLPVMVDFGASGCVPCDMMAPIMKELESSLTGKCSILFIDVRDYQVLSARYGISGIPTQVFFDQEGRETFRHTGFFPKEEILAQLSQLGVQ